VSIAAQLPWLAAAVFLVGAPHGALDHRAGRLLLRPRVGRSWWAVFGLLYLAATASALAFWLTAPGLALVAFLLIAALHFGEHDSSSGHPLAIAVRGSIAPVVAAAAHPGAMREIFGWIGGEGGAALVPWLAGPGLLLWLCGAVGVLALEPQRPKRLELLALTALFGLVPPLVAFAAYFALLHTPRALVEARQPGEDWRDVLRSAAPLTMAAALLGGGGYLLLRQSLAVEPAAVRTIFWWLGALTVPHMGLAFLVRRTSPTAAAPSSPGWQRSAAAG
jgi:Brp/Blh family beta-carotene 15,15'-monooxygenase